MNSLDFNNEFCFICNKFMNSFRNNLSVTNTRYSEMSLLTFIGKVFLQCNFKCFLIALEYFFFVESFNEITLADEPLDGAAVCQSCMIKINEFDDYTTKAMRIKDELINVYKSTHDSSQLEILQTNLQLDEFFPEFEFDFVLNETTDLKTTTSEPKNDEVSEEFRKLLEKEGIKYDIEVFQRAFNDDETSPKKRKIKSSRSKRLIGSFTCDFCAMKGFKNRQAFTYHLKSHIKGPFYCDLCKTSFRSVNSLKIHLISDHGNIKQDIPCPFTNCQKSFANATALRSHFICHEKTDTNPSYVCDTCGKNCFYG